LHKLEEVDRFSRPLSNYRPLNNHKHNQLLMEAVEVEVEEEVAVVVADQHLLQEVQPPNKQ